jgi:hypothetical protein
MPIATRQRVMFRFQELIRRDMVCKQELHTYIVPFPCEIIILNAQKNISRISLLPV